MQFSRAYTAAEPTVITAAEHDFRVEQKPEPAIRWLGVWFDRKLRFRTHVEQRATTTRNVVRHIQSLANTQRGPQPSALRKVVKTVVIPCLTYGAEAWYEGLVKIRKCGSQVTEARTKQEHLVGIVSRTLTPALRAILPVWRTTPTPVLYKEAAIPVASHPRRDI